MLVGAAERGRRPATLERRRIRGIDLPADELQRAVREAVTGYVTIDLVLEVAFALGALPPRTVIIEVEPALPGPADHLSPEVERVLPEVVRLAREEASAAVDELDELERGMEPRPGGYATTMDENDQQNQERERDPGALRRTTEQGDELTEEHSLAMREHRTEAPYAPPRQPSQDPPSGS